MLKCISILFLLANLIYYTPGESARILAAFPTPGISHQVVFRPLTQELVRRGHEVTVITTDPAFPKGQTPTNLTEIDVHELSYKEWRAKLVVTADGQKSSYGTQLRVFLDIITTLFEQQMQIPEVQRILQDKNKTFDLLILESCVRPALGLSYKYKVPVISASSFGAIARTYDSVGAPTHPFLYPNLMSLRLYNLSVWEKLEVFYNHHMFTRMYDLHEKYENEALQRIFGPETPPLSELAHNVDMVFLNTYRIWEGNFPMPPSVVYMGGIHQKPLKELPQDLQKFLDDSKHGVIYMSFGTNKNPSALPPEKIQMFVNVFSHLPYDVLWKWDKDELPGQSRNIRIQKWFPQSDLLGHPKIKLFITQGGLQSTDEAITSGVPLIGIPMMADQWYNVEKYVYHKIGVRLDIDTLTEAKLREAIQCIIRDNSFRSNIIKLRSLMMDQPETALERAVWWTEYVLRHSGAKHLRSPAANMSWTQYYEIELVCLVFISLLLMLLFVLVVLRHVARYLAIRVKVKGN